MVPQKLVQNDVGTILKFTILDQDKNVVNVSGTTVTLYIQRSDTVLAKTCTPVDATNGIVQYTIQSGDLSIGDDTYTLTVQVGFTSGDRFTAINSIPVEILKSPSH